MTKVAAVVGALLFVSTALLAGGLVLWFGGDQSATPTTGLQSGRGGLTIGVMYTLTWFEVGVVGALIAARRPINPIGWLIMTASTFAGLQSLCNGYAGYAAVHPELPVRVAASWIGSWIGPPALGLIVVILLVFPTGGFVFGWSRGVAWLAMLSSLAQAAGLALEPGPLRGHSAVLNPFAAAGELPMLAHALGTAGLVLSMLGAAVQLSLRLRRARGKERQQLKWIAYAAAMFTLGLLALGFAPPDWNAPAAVLFALTGAGLTSAVGVAMLRYQLFDIDVLINRTLVYGSLIVTLSAAYAAAIALLQVVLAPVTGGSEIAIALSTLSVAALSGPALRRIREGIDRRFYRRRYDAARTLEAFNMRLREEVDLDTLTAELLEIVQDTMQPTRMKLWLRPASVDSTSSGPPRLE